jgi:integrase
MPVIYGVESREPVHSGNRRVPGLYQRTLVDGSVVFEFRGRLGGKVTRRRLEASTKTDAVAELRALQVDFERGDVGRSPALAVTVSELAVDWWIHLEARTTHRDPRQRRSRRTVEDYRQRFEKHIEPELGMRPVNELTVHDVRRLVDRLAAKKLSPSTITNSINILSGLLRFGIKNGQVDRNPVRDLDRDDRPGAGRVTEPRYLDPDELELLFSKLTDTFRPIAVACAFAGLRISEALGLRWRDVDFKAEEIHVREQLGAHGELVPVKTTASAAAVPLLPRLARELRAHHQRQRARGFDRVRPDALVFSTTRGRPQSRRNALRAIHKAGDDVGLNTDGREKVGVHDLRHSFVANALAAGVTLPEAATLARHTDARVTAIVYAGISDQTRNAIAGKLTQAGIGT